MLAIFAGLLILSFIIALRSMKDLEIPEEIRRMIASRKIKGTILFLKNKITHYSSASSS